MKRAGILTGLLFAVVAAAACASSAYGQVFSGYVDLTYDHIKSRTDYLQAGSTASSGYSFLQRYNLNYSAMLYPYLSFKMGYLYERFFSENETDDSRFHSTSIKMLPSVELGLSNPLFSAATGFRRLEQKQIPGVTLFRDTYDAGFGLKPEERRPTFNILYCRQDTYDKERSVQDTVIDTVSASSRYQPTKELELRYQISYSDTDNRLTGFESNSLGQSAWISYGTELFDRKVALNTNYRAMLSTVESSFSGSAGSVAFPVTAAQGISGEGTYGSVGTPTQLEDPLFERMVYKPLLIDADIATGTDINIGYTPLNQNKRSIGLVFAKPEKMNTLYIYVNQDISAIAADFTWDVYISSAPLPIDAGPKQWKLWQPAAGAVFNALDKRFEISFPDVETQFIKVVTAPRSSPLPVFGIDTANILVTEVQAIRVASAQSVREQITRSFSQQYDLNVRTRIMEAPVLIYYDFFSEVIHSEPDGSTRYSLSNSVTASRRFSSIFSGTARVSREDDSSEHDHLSTETASMSLTATPLRTLAHSLVVSATEQKSGSGRTSGQSAFLSNVAEVYRGLSLNAGAGTNSSSTSTGVESRNSLFNAGATIIPHRLVTINVNHSDTASRQFGGSIGEISGRQSMNSGSLSYSPFPALYLYGSVSVTSARGTERTVTQSYSTTWSPFSGGALQFFFGYSEQIQSPSNDVITTGSVSMRWRINPRLFLNSGYTKAKVEAATSRSKSDSYDINARWMF